MSNKTIKELTVTFSAEDFGLPKSIMRTDINDYICSYDAEGKNSGLLGGLLQKFCDNPFGKIISSEKIPEGIKEALIKEEIVRITNNQNIIYNSEALLKFIYLEGLTLTFKIETSEILPKIPEVPEKIYGKEINLKKLSTGHLLINNYLITDSSDFIKSICYILERKVSVSYHYNQIKIKSDYNDKSIIIDKPFEKVNEIDINLIKKIAKQIMLDDIVSEETFVI